ncbi:hypothetical protein Cs7R123_13900 [Catellatospora sp. TT07R-123]|uniref:CG0192-related protein n=1 Tax=Catellatospora sp. TT07R-123 TaxID=2733863 RepID=UPI001B141BB2|nr:hypothetical protein [Catellatospora sp. TT07R-123]GHJ44048.1 hypothetical protein Cs7R123_13900 [Catellatospora sp. TT07R-123]
MALLHNAEIHPTKLELLAAWLPTRTWYEGPAEPVLERVAACRFDDPAGEVGIETMIVRAGDGPLLHVPLTYRGAPLDGAQRWLVGTTDHSVLGKRWVYDGCGDPVYVAALAHAVFTGGEQAPEFIEEDGRAVPRTPAMTVRGTGVAVAAPVVGEVATVDADPTLIDAGAVELAVARVLDPAAAPDEGLALHGRLPGLVAELSLAWVR